MTLLPNQATVTIGQAVEITPAADHPTRTYKADFDTAAWPVLSTKPKP